MRGILEDKAIEIGERIDSCKYLECSIEEWLRDECRELQEPWIPIEENTPRDRQIKIYDDGYGQVVVQWNAYFRCFTDPHGHKYLNPTHYQELPADPVMPIHKPEPPR